jgi:hypothetical protein
MVWRCARRAAPRAECRYWRGLRTTGARVRPVSPAPWQVPERWPLSYAWPNGIIGASAVWIDREFHPDSVFYGTVAQAIVCACDRCSK